MDTGYTRKQGVCIRYLVNGLIRLFYCFTVLVLLRNVGKKAPKRLTPGPPDFGNKGLQGWSLGAVQFKQAAPIQGVTQKNGAKKSTRPNFSTGQCL